MKELIELLTKQGKTISTMESCTGGGIANAITNTSGSSLVFNYGAVTYSNEYKIKMGVPSEIIDKYTVYSMEVAVAMAKAISNYTNSTYGVGVTGKLREADTFNPCGEDDIVYVRGGVDAFAHCDSLTGIHVNSANAYDTTVDGVLFNKDQTTLCWIGKV